MEIQHGNCARVLCTIVTPKLLNQFFWALQSKWLWAQIWHRAPNQGQLASTRTWLKRSALLQIEHRPPIPALRGHFIKRQASTGAHSTARAVQTRASNVSREVRTRQSKDKSQFGKKLAHSPRSSQRGCSNNWATERQSRKTDSSAARLGTLG